MLNLSLCLFSSHQPNVSPISTAAASPTMHKDHWQQRRHNFLSKHNMLGGELKDEFLEQSDQGTSDDTK